MGLEQVPQTLQWGRLSFWGRGQGRGLARVWGSLAFLIGMWGFNVLTTGVAVREHPSWGSALPLLLFLSVLYPQPSFTDSGTHHLSPSFCHLPPGPHSRASLLR